MKPMVCAERAPEIQRLLDQALDDQRSSWNRDEPNSVEFYIAQVPPLRHDVDAILDLIYQEYIIRRERAENPDPAEFCTRFPDVAEPLMLQFGVHAAIEPTTERRGHSVPASNAMPEPLEEIGGYEIMRVLGRGGMGVVYQARDLELGRIVAIKTIAQGRYATPDQRERFRAEALAIARLRHPGIISIHAIAEYESQPYLSLEFAAGGNLAQKLVEKPVAAREAAELLETLGRAVHAAHLAGIVHRDLKPSNVLLTAEGKPKISDFGLAKLLDADSERTVSGQIMGSPSYMAPEQAEGRAKQVGPSADIYALGAILYHALTGRPPFLCEFPLETLKLVSSADPVLPRQLRPDIARDLESICLKCLEKRPTDRYVTADELAEDLRRFLDGRPILARPVSLAGRTWRWCRRNPWVAGLSAAVFTVLVAGTIVSTLLAIRAVRAEAATRRQLVRAERSSDQAFRAINAIVSNEQGDFLSEELRSYREALVDSGLRLATEMLEEPENDARGLRAQADAFAMQAKLLSASGKRQEVRAAGNQAIEAAERRLAANPADTVSRSDLAQILHQLGAMEIDPEAIRSHARRSNEISEALLRENPRSTDAPLWIGQIAKNTHNIGHSYSFEIAGAEGASRVELIGKALIVFQEGERFCVQQISNGNQTEILDESLAHIKINLCRAYRELAKYSTDASEKAANLKKAVEYGKNAVAEFKSLADRSPDHFQRGWTLHQFHCELGQLFVESDQGNNPQEAISHYESARDTLKSLAARHGNLVSRMATIQQALAQADHNLSMAYANADPVRYYDGPLRATVGEMYEICDKLGLVQPLSWDQRKIYAYSCLDMAGYQATDGEKPDVGLLRKGQQLWDELHRKSPGDREARGMLVLARTDLADELAEQGRAGEASGWRTRSLLTVRGDPALCYELATIYASNASFAVKCPTKLNAHQTEVRRRRCVQHGMSLLREAIAAGFADAQKLRNDPALAPFQSDPEFQHILRDLEFPEHPFARQVTLPR
jgi:serine/threonine protein kinase